MWFERLTGFDERSAIDVAGRFDVDGEWLTSRANGRRMRAGRPRWRPTPNPARPPSWRH